MLIALFNGSGFPDGIRVGSGYFLPGAGTEVSRDGTRIDRGQPGTRRDAKVPLGY